MITDQDITKLAQVFATKADLLNFATKDDLANFATKDDLRLLKDEVGDLRVDVGDLREDIVELRTEVGVLAHRIDTVDVKMDKFVGAVDILESENKSGANTMYRHRLQIRALANGTGVSIPDE